MGRSAPTVNFSTLCLSLKLFLQFTMSRSRSACHLLMSFLSEFRQAEKLLNVVHWWIKICIVDRMWKVQHTRDKLSPKLWVYIQVSEFLDFDNPSCTPNHVSKLETSSMCRISGNRSSIFGVNRVDGGKQSSVPVKILLNGMGLRTSNF